LSENIEFAMATEQPKKTTATVPSKNRRTSAAVVRPLTNQRSAVLRKLHEKRSYILAAIETYMLRATVASKADAAMDESVLPTAEQQACITRTSFLNILRQQQQIRRELLEKEHGLPRHTLQRMHDKYAKWDDARLARLLSLLNDLYRQIHALIADANEIEPWNTDMQVLAAVTGGEAAAVPGQINFNLFSTIYTVVFKLV
jgi:hypothetical protein